MTDFPGPAGTQALAVAVRALASKELSEVNAYRTVFREMAVGLANGAALAYHTGWPASLYIKLAVNAC